MIKVYKLVNIKLVRQLLLVFVGLALGWFIFSPVKENNSIEKNESEVAGTIWTCSMHPTIRKENPGSCPICGMDLIPLINDASDTVETSVKLTEDAIALSNILTTKVSKSEPIKEIRLYGKVEANESFVQSQVAHISGRIERLMVNFIGQQVYKGQVIAKLYSPELVVAQKELLETSRMKNTEPLFYEAAKEKLLLLKMTADQINLIEKAGTVQNSIEVFSETTGYVTKMDVKIGDYVTPGSVFFEVADLNTVWIQFDAYESDLMFIDVNDKIYFSFQALPGKTFSGNVSFIEPVLDAKTRVAKIRVEISNKDKLLKPEMFCTGIINADLREYNGSIIVPRSSVLWTGKRSLVYVRTKKLNESYFTLREVELGPMLGNGYVILNGLTEGEEIVVQGTFNVDAAAQLEGKKSMLNDDLDRKTSNERAVDRNKSSATHKH